MHVLILQGGDSPERDISLRSADSVMGAMRGLGYTVEAYDTADGFEALLPLLARADIVFPVLHGVNGEDGTVQELLEAHQVSYVGSDAASSRRCFDKPIAKRALTNNGLPTPSWEEVTKESFAAAELTKQPHVLKPCRGGSSIDTFIVRDTATQAADTAVFDSYQSMLLEELVIGTELTVSVLDDDPLPVIEIRPPKNAEFDYNNKYNGKTRELCPPESIDQNMQEEAQEVAAQAHQALGARHFSRVDLIMTPNGEFSVLELNTIPGLTEQSLLPKAAAAAGISMSVLVDRLLTLARRGV